MSRIAESLAESGAYTVIQEFPCDTIPDDHLVLSLTGAFVRIYIETLSDDADVYDLSPFIHLSDDTIDDLITTLQYVKRARNE